MLYQLSRDSECSSAIMFCLVVTMRFDKLLAITKNEEKLQPINLPLNIWHGITTVRQEGTCIVHMNVLFVEH